MNKFEEINASVIKAGKLVTKLGCTKLTITKDSIQCEVHPKGEAMNKKELLNQLEQERDEVEVKMLALSEAITKVSIKVHSDVILEIGTSDIFIAMKKQLGGMTDYLIGLEKRIKLLNDEDYDNAFEEVGCIIN